MVALLVPRYVWLEGGGSRWYKFLISYVIGFNASSNESLNRDTAQRGKRLIGELIKKKKLFPHAVPRCHLMIIHGNDIKCL